MNIIRSGDSEKINRRQFLRRGAGLCAGFSMAGMYSALSSLRMMEAKAAQCPPPGNDYRALICLFMFGGNDANNVIVPYDNNGYNAYRSARDVLSIPQASLLPIQTPDIPGDDREWGLHPQLTGLKSLYDQGKCTFVVNTGTLLAPITKAEYLAGGSAIPPFLYSHNDQQAQWQSSVPDAQKKVGWGGKIADLKQALNECSSISMNISVAGNNFFQIGDEVFQYQVGNSGSVGINYWNVNDPRLQAMKTPINSLFAHDYDNLFEQEYAAIARRAVTNDALISSTLNNIPVYLGNGAGQYFPRRGGTAAEPTYSGLQRQLNIILRLIASRQPLGMRRQIFFCSIGGFDTHDAQVDLQEDLLYDVGTSVAEFYNGLAGLGVADNVTLFSASDFSRTYNSNGNGTDHAWGSNHFVVGGSVNGGRLYGQMPLLTPRGPDDANTRGVWIPTTSVDEYAATLARWFGVEMGEMSYILPNIGRFAHPDLGFMNPVV
jgi:uncharacterized protein (DUF1501 family)